MTDPDVDIDPDQTLYRVRAKNTGKTAGVLHTDRDCQSLKSATSVFETTRRQYPDREFCAYCTGGADTRSAYDKTLECEHCDREFSSVKGHTTHIAREHPEAVDDVFDGQLATDGGILAQARSVLTRSAPSATPDTTPETDLDTLLTLLANERRRHVIRLLGGDAPTLECDTLAETIAAAEQDCAPANLSRKERKRVYVGLYQTHLPRLDDADIIDLEHGSVVHATAETERVARVLTEIEAAAGGDA